MRDELATERALRRQAEQERDKGIAGREAADERVREIMAVQEAHGAPKSGRLAFGSLAVRADFLHPCPQHAGATEPNIRCVIIHAFIMARRVLVCTRRQLRLFSGLFTLPTNRSMPSRHSGLHGEPTPKTVIPAVPPTRGEMLSGHAAAAARSQCSVDRSQCSVDGCRPASLRSGGGVIDDGSSRRRAFRPVNSLKMAALSIMSALHGVFASSTGEPQHHGRSSSQVLINYCCIKDFPHLQASPSIENGLPIICTPASKRPWWMTPSGV